MLLFEKKTFLKKTDGDVKFLPNNIFFPQDLKLDAASTCFLEQPGLFTKVLGRIYTCVIECPYALDI
jgi:hypothetical protein